VSKNIQTLKRAMDLLFKANFDKEEALFIIARDNPAAFLKAIQSTQKKTIQTEIENLARNEQKINAIRSLREVTGDGLRKTKEDVEHFQKYDHWPIDVQIIFSKLKDVSYRKAG
jgi:ribosomal protein L7/L12